MNPTTMPQEEAATALTAAVDDLMTLIDELNTVVDEENRVLARGLPASLSRFTARKNELADEFERWVAAIAGGRISLWSVDSARRERFLAAVARLHKDMDENVERLRSAIDASRRRIDAVMQAIRNEFRTASPYGADGRIASPSIAPASGGPGVCV
jgi:flagellar biosynthesis/type III secretory pathway chaperone